MAKKEVYTSIDGRNVKLSNLSKVLYPSTGIIKAQLIQYYLKVTKYMIPFLEQRPITLIRYPDGVDANRFYSKNRPSWTPNWVGKIKVDPEDDNTYSTVNDPSTLAWMANLATLEFHPMTLRATHLGRPDHFILDLDPPSDASFEVVKELALDLKQFLSSHDYHPFVKTSGGKGLHIYVPIIPKYEQDTVITAVKELAKKYIQLDPETTLKLNKEKRKDKVLIDIYRNSKSQTCVAPYSTRGKAEAPVSTPLYWEELPNISSSQQYNLQNVLEKVASDGDPWEAFVQYAQPLHNQVQADVAPALQTYSQKRDFGKTEEPNTDLASDYVPQSRYVVQIHDASNLYYDLRLEQEGVLRSWAIPKGLPTQKGIKRLAIETEPHPIKYLTFEGKIPKGEYGGGEMWVFDSGTFTLIKKEKKKLYFSLDGDLKGNYRIFNTKEKQWLIERLDDTPPKHNSTYKPMLAVAGSKIPDGSNYFYEIKWDGLRVIIKKIGKEVSITSRNGNDLTPKFPKIVDAIGEIEAETIIADGEIVVLAANGAPNFSKVVGRMHLQGKNAILQAATQTKAVIYLFDCLYLDGKDLRQSPIEKRRAWLRANIDISEHLRYSDTFEDGKALFEAIKAQQMEGIMCKLRGSLYASDSRSKSWLKIKVQNTDEAYLIGYTKGKGDRSALFGSLQLAKKDPDGWQYKGRVGTGFSQELLKTLFKKISDIPVSKKLISQSVDEESRTTWIEPHYLITVKYASLTPNGTYREPVYVSMRSLE